MVYALSKFVSIPSVSSSQQHKEDCRQAAIWLRKCLGQLGAQSFLVSVLFYSLRTRWINDEGVLDEMVGPIRMNTLLI